MKASIPRWSLDLVMEEETPYTTGSASLSDPRVAAPFLAKQIASKPQEHMLALFLDGMNRPLGWTVLHIGTLNRAAVEPRAAFQTGLLLNAASFILAHNHPSGTPTPSREDVAYTRRMADAGNLMGIPLLDHIILGHAGQYISMRQAGHWQ